MTIKFDKNNRIESEWGVPMAVDYIYPSDAKKLSVVIYTHGFNGFKDWGNFDLIAKAFATEGIFFIKYNLSHNGTNLKNTDEFADLQLYRENNYTKEVSDLKLVIQHILQKDFKYAHLVDSSSVSLLGHSRGVAASLLNGKRGSISKIISWAGIGACTSPWTNFSIEKMETWKKDGVFYYSNKRTNQEMPIDYQQYEDYIAHKEEYDLLHTVAQMKKPMLFIHGRKDVAVPYQIAEKYHEANPQHSQLILTDSDHVFGRKHPWPYDYLPEQTKFVVEQTILFLFNDQKFRRPIK